MNRQQRRATLSPSRTLCIGMDVHKESIAGAYGAHDHGAEVMYLGASGTRQCAIGTKQKEDLKKSAGNS